MQNKRMKQEKHEFVLLAVPAALLLEAGIFEGDAMMMYTAGRKLIIENCDDVFICTGDCEKCPAKEADCDGECDDCPCREHCDESEAE